ncbi:MAG TPA: hypothetical protein GX400_22000, partial [Chloroflexi bacterium]|nr:hypothetical protein [Chloroflexota bacterium]
MPRPDFSPFHPLRPAVTYIWAIDVDLRSPAHTGTAFSPQKNRPLESGLPTFGAATEKPEWRLQTHERTDLEERTARAAHHLLRAVRKELASAPGKQDVVRLA